MVPPTYARGSQMVKFLDADHSYEVSRPYLKYAYYSYPQGLRKNFCKHQCVIILQHTDIFKCMLLEFVARTLEQTQKDQGQCLKHRCLMIFSKMRTKNPIAFWNYAIIPTHWKRIKKKWKMDCVSHKGSPRKYL